MCKIKSKAIHKEVAAQIREMIRDSKFVKGQRIDEKNLLAKIGGTDLLGLLSSIVLCGHVTDVSPLSTLGAIFIANATEDQNKKKLFRDMIIWGLAMAPIGAIVSWFMFTVLRIP